MEAIVLLEGMFSIAEAGRVGTEQPGRSATDCATAQDVKATRRHGHNFMLPVGWKGAGSH